MIFRDEARQEADRRVEEAEGLNYDMEVDAFVLGAEWASELITSTTEGDWQAWLRSVKAGAWHEGASSRQCHCHAYSEGECACGMWPSERNPYTA
jgi:hypothetical protein